MCAVVPVEARAIRASRDTVWTFDAFEYEIGGKRRGPGFSVIVIDSGLDPNIPLPLGISVTPSVTVR